MSVKINPTGVENPSFILFILQKTKISMKHDIFSNNWILFYEGVNSCYLHNPVGDMERYY